MKVNAVLDPLTGLDDAVSLVRFVLPTTTSYGSSNGCRSMLDTNGAVRSR